MDHKLRYQVDEDNYWFNEYPFADVQYKLPESKDPNSMNLTCLYCEKEIGYIYHKDKPFEEILQINKQSVIPYDRE